MQLPNCCESLCPNYLTHHHTQIYNTTLTKSVFFLPKHSITCYTVLLLTIYFDLTGAVTVVPSTYRLTTPRGPPRKVEWANRWALLWEGRFGTDCDISATEDMGSCESCAHACARASVHVYTKSTFVYVCVQVCIVCSCTCAFVVVCWGWDGGARWCNTRCLKSVGLTACHKTSWLIESPGMSSPAALMNPKPKGLMKRVPFAKTVPQLDLP